MKVTQESAYIHFLGLIGKVFSKKVVSCLAPSRRGGLFGAVLALVLAVGVPLQAEVVNLQVDFDTVVQENFLGVNAVYHGFSFLPESIEQGMTDELRALEMDRVEKSGLRLARTFFRPDWAMGEGEWVKPDWQSPKMEALYSWLAEMQSRNITVALNMGWWFGRDVIWNRDQHLPSYPDDLKNYAAWVSEALRQIITVRGFNNVEYIFMFTEPGGSYGDLPWGKSVQDYYKEVLMAVHQRLVDDGLRHLVKMVGPNTTQAPRWVAEAAVVMPQLDVLASHNYNFTTYGEWYGMAMKVRQAAKGSGKPFWVDEYGIQDIAIRRAGRYGTILGLANAAFLNVGAQTSLLWIYNDQYYPYPLKHITNGDAFLDGKHSWGLFPWLSESRIPRPAWYAFTMMSRLLGGQQGTKVFKSEGSGELATAATGLPSGDTSILVVNGYGEAKDVRITFSQPSSAPLKRYLYDPAKIQPDSSATPLSSDKEFVMVATEINDRLQAGAVAVYSTLTQGASGPASGRVRERAADEVGEENLALGKPVTASSFDPQWPPIYLTDGKRLSGWQGMNRPAPAQDHLVVDLGMISEVEQVDFFPSYTNDQKDMGISVKISLSRDQQQWQAVAEDRYATSTPAQLHSHRFPATPARYVRVQLQTVSVNGGTPFAHGLAELKVYGRGATSPGN